MKDYRVLSLDGGGIRGLYTAVLLQGLTKEFAKQSGLDDSVEYDLGKQFDMIVGTSTGAILAAALAAGVSLTKVIELYTKKAHEIFQDPVPSHGGSEIVWSFRNSYSAANKPQPLQTALDEVFVALTMGQLFHERGIALCIPSVDAETLRAWVFKTPHTPRLQRDTNYRVADVCMASAAAPLIFPLKRIERNDPTGAPEAKRVNWFIDGGLWANNPAVVALTEALSTAPKGQRIVLVSVSTCPPFKGTAVNDATADRGLLAWKAGIRMTETALDSQSFAYDYITRTLAEHACQPVEYVRLADPDVGVEDLPHLGMDNPSAESLKRLVSLAHRAVDKNRSEATAGSSPSKAILNSVFSGMSPLNPQPAHAP